MSTSKMSHEMRTSLGATSSKSFCLLSVTNMSLPLKICVISGQTRQEFLTRSGQRITFYHKDHSSVRYEAMLYRGIERCFRTSKALLCKRQSIELRPQKHCSKGCEAMFMKRQNKAPYAMKQCCLIERTVLLKQRE